RSQVPEGGAFNRSDHVTRDTSKVLNRVLRPETRGMETLSWSLLGHERVKRGLRSVLLIRFIFARQTESDEQLQQSDVKACFSTRY
ncbi:hypothetical protein RRG08_000523, partial [Elysia crispata]